MYNSLEELNLTRRVHAYTVAKTVAKFDLKLAGQLKA